MIERVNLGDKVRDRLSGVVGICVCRAEWMYGCIRCSIQPQELKDGRPVDTVQIDEPQLEVLERGAVANVPNWRESIGVSQRPAGPREAITRPDVSR